jgi:predicted Zn-dependent protease
MNKSSPSPRHEIPFSRRMLLFFVGLAVAAAAIVILPRFDDRSIVGQTREVHAGAARGMGREMGSDPRQAIISTYREDPSNVGILISAAHIYAERGKFREALEMIEVGRRDHPDNNELRQLKAQFLAALDSADEATTADHSSGLPEGHPPIAGQVAAGGLEEVRAALEANPGDFNLAFSAGMSQLGREDYAAAHELLGKAAQIRPGDVETVLGLSVTHTLLDRPEEAVRLLEGLLTKHPEEGMAWFNLAFLHEKYLDRPDRALELYERCRTEEVVLEAEFRRRAREAADRLTRKGGTKP